MKQIIKRILLSLRIARLLHKQLIRASDALVSIIDQQSIVLNGGVHPKHRLMAYETWFKEQIQPGWRVVDIGCGIGMTSACLADKAKQVFAIDFHQPTIERARASHKHSTISFVCGDATTFDYKTLGEIDCVVMSNVLEHIEDRRQLLNNLRTQVMWSPGHAPILLIRVPMITRSWLVLYKRELGMEWRSDLTHFIEYTKEQFTKELSSSGLAIDLIEITFGEIWAVCSIST